jgi:hypothetical protein
MTEQNGIAGPPEVQHKPLDFDLKSLNIREDEHMASEDSESDDEDNNTVQQPEDASPTEDPAHLGALTQALFQRAEVLLCEVETWIEAVHEKKLSTGQRAVEYRTIRNDIEAEIGFLTKLTKMDLRQEKARHYIDSSNLMYFEAMWAAAKRSSGLLAFRKNLFYSRPANRHRGKEQEYSPPSDRVMALTKL